MSADGPRYPEYPGEQPGPRPEPLPAFFGAPATGPVADPAPVRPREREVPLAGWWVRVGATLLDGLILFLVVLVPTVVGLVVLLADARYVEATDTFEGIDPIGWVVLGLAAALYVGFDVWNRGVRTGYRGQSLGKQALGLHVVHRSTGRPTGAMEGFFRWLVAVLLSWTCVGQVLDLLWPLWDERNQTIHDKAIGTIVVRR